MGLESMRNINRVVALIFVLAIAAVCFVFALLFGIAGLSAVSQVTFQQLTVLFSFCIIFSIAGSSFLTIADLLYVKVRRCA
jgi:hypothetical protein